MTLPWKILVHAYSESRCRKLEPLDSSIALTGLFSFFPSKMMVDIASSFYVLLMYIVPGMLHEARKQLAQRYQTFALILWYQEIRYKYN